MKYAISLAGESAGIMIAAVLQTASTSGSGEIYRHGIMAGMN